VADALKPDALLGVLFDHEVEFIVIGGYAVALHGVVRATKDIDICPAPDKDNLQRLADALRELEARPLDLESVIPDVKWLQRTANWTLRTKFGRLDVMQALQGLGKGHGGYRDLQPHTVEAAFLGYHCRFCSYEDLVKMKQATGRPQDEIDIESLKAARGEQ
jgi:hypothetical protein